MKVSTMNSTPRFTYFCTGLFKRIHLNTTRARLLALFSLVALVSTAAVSASSPGFREFLFGRASGDTAKVVNPAVPQLAPNGLTVYAAAATVATDKSDYAPGSTVLISGSDWGPGETVALHISEDHLNEVWDWTTQADGSGNINTTFQILANDAGVTFTLTATGQSSNQTATATFTDSSNPTAKDWQAENGGFGSPPINPVDWVSGNVNGTKGHYLEGQSIPYSVCLGNLTPGVPATTSFKYDTLKGGKHAIDFITSNNRIAEVVDPTDACSGTYGAESLFPIPTPAGTTTASCFTALPPAERQMSIFNGTISNLTYVSQGSETSTGDETTVVRVTFTPSSSSVILSWGGHIASEQDCWGIGNGATSVPGSPYHTALNGPEGICQPVGTCFSTGDQDMQLAAAAVCNPPLATAIVNQTVCKGSTATFSTTATGSGTLSFQWKIDGTNTSTAVTSTATTSSIAIDTTGLSAGNHDVCVVVTSSSSCGSPGDTKCAVLTVDQVTATSTKTDVSCNGSGDGSMTVTITSGTGPFTCSLDGGAFNSCSSGDTFGSLSTGPHTVTVKDSNTCTGSTSKTIGEPDALVVSSTKVDVSCNGGSDGSITVTISGGTGPYTCSKDGGLFAACVSGDTFGSLAAGPHTIDVKDAHNCPGSTSKTINEPDTLTVSLPEPSCANNNNTTNITATAAGGNGGNLFDWHIIGGSFVDIHCSPGPTCQDITDGVDTVTYTTSGGQVSISVNVHDINGCQASTHRDFDCTVLQAFCALTQGFYGNPGGRFYHDGSCYNGFGTLSLIQQLLGATPIGTCTQQPSGLTVGVTDTRSLIIPLSAAQCIITRLPAGGTPTTLPNFGFGGRPKNRTLQDPNICQVPTFPGTGQDKGLIPLSSKGKFDNVLLGQTIALSLNLRLDPTLANLDLTTNGTPVVIHCRTYRQFCTQGTNPDGSPIAGDIRTLLISQDVIDALNNPAIITDATHLGKVSGLLDLANRALAGLGTGSATVSDINAAVDAINGGFDKCRLLTSCPVPVAPAP